MAETSNQDPLHGVTLKMIVKQLENKYGWVELGRRINIKCFTHDPSLNSSLKFLRRTPWARKKVEVLYLGASSQAGDVWARAQERRNT
jgi:uncharacterized protein (DUF2132 family)